MRKTVYIVFMMSVWMMTFTGCKNEKPAVNADSTVLDTEVTDTTDSDTMAEIIAETPMPKAADQLFDDFFFNFIASPKVQKARIKWPLPIVTYTDKQEHTVLMKKNQWKMDKFFRKQGYYTLIFDNEKQMSAAKSTKLDTVVVEKIKLREGSVTQYWFDHQNGKWEMNQIRNISFQDSKNASFLTFLQKFFTADGRGMIKDPLPYHGADPNGEETNIITTTIPASDWSTYLPTVPGDVIYNILYGQKYGEGKTKILDFKGLANGLETQLIFKKQKGDWHLVKINAY
ncbi:DUF4348 domain-containing protein [uncultured Prevotella sp.]|uniref:DUF4348 domain-containing protein n=1 Tax=uncultured Prevotella sp. TaxID=159272 RepID=UPI002588B8B3|nr:DUF4348 domain-containing protein [uncultured Prevotella sp.]